PYKKILAVVRPFGRGDTLDLVRQHFARLQIFYLQCILAVPGDVGSKRQKPPILARRNIAYGKIFVALRHLVLIEQKFPGGSILHFAAEIGWILLALFGLRKIPIVAKLVRYARVVLLYAAEHFLVKAVDKSLVFAHEGLSVFIVGLEIFDDLGVFLLVAVTQ